jgi:hypothetical protein
MARAVLAPGGARVEANGGDGDHAKPDGRDREGRRVGRLQSGKHRFRGVWAASRLDPPRLSPVRAEGLAHFGLDLIRDRGFGVKLPGEEKAI